jgi:hypothetical protein
MDFAAIFTKYRVPFVEIGPWRSHVRPGTFTPEGVLIHHTGSTGYASTLNVVRYGRPDLAGPLCNIYIAKGKAHIISAGRANHAGMGSSEALARLRRDVTPNGTARSMGFADDTNGNGLFVGFEILAKGDGSPVPLADWNVSAQAAAAILKELRHPDTARCIGHAEWTRRKPDPMFGRGATAYQNMQAFRTKLAPYFAS